MAARASIIAVGTELLRGEVQDANSPWLARKLTESGFDVRRIVIVGDDPGEIARALRQSLEDSELVVVAGGLGLTEDDVTMEAVARALGLGLELNPEALELIKARVGSEYARWEKAARLPSGAKPLPNEVGVSPGALIDAGGKKVVVLPGVPSEMRRMFEAHALPALGRAGSAARAELVTAHAVEAEVDRLLSPVRARHPRAYVKTHASRPVRVSIVAFGESAEEACRELESVLSEALRALGPARVERLEGCAGPAPGQPAPTQ